MTLKGRASTIALAIALVSALPQPARAQQHQQQPPQQQRVTIATSAAAIAAAADWATTYHALRYYRVREANPLLRRLDSSPGKLVMLGAAIDISGALAWNHFVGKKHPTIAASGMWAMTAFRAYLAMHNMRNTQRAARR
jgi:hypothetical protein